MEDLDFGASINDIRKVLDERYPGHVITDTGNGSFTIRGPNINVNINTEKKVHENLRVE